MVSVPAEVLQAALCVFVQMATLEMATHAKVHCLPYQCAIQSLTSMNSPTYCTACRHQWVHNRCGYMWSQCKLCQLPWFIHVQLQTRFWRKWTTMHRYRESICLLQELLENLICLTVAMFWYLSLTDLNECAQESNDCSAFADCFNTDGSYECQCQDGYTGDGQLCVVEQILAPECRVGSNDCGPNAVCVTLTNSNVCQCQEGFTGDGTTCTGIYMAWDQVIAGIYACMPGWP